MERRIVVDTREQLPWLFHHGDTVYDTVTEGLPEGDYCLEGELSTCAIERKSLPDFVSSITWGRDRFEAELARLNANVEHPFVFIEASQQNIIDKLYPNNVRPRVLVGSRFSFEVDYPAVHFCWCGSRRLAEFNAIVLFADIERKLKRTGDRRGRNDKRKKATKRKRARKLAGSSPRR